MKRILNFLFKNQSLRQTVIKNTFWLTLGQLSSKLIKAVLIIYAARVLGAGEYGIFSYALGLAGFFTLFSDIGISWLLTREAAKQEEVQKNYIGTALVIKFALILLGAGAILFLAPQFTKIPAALSLLPAIAILLALDSLREFSFSIIRARERMELEAGINIVTNTGITVFGLIILFASPTSEMLTFAYLGGSGLGLLVSILLLKKYFLGIWRFFKSGLVRTIIRDAWPFAFLGMLGSIMINTDMIMLGWLTDAENVGFYSAAQKPIQLSYILPGILIISLFPSLARFARSNNEKFKEILENVLSISFLFAIPLALGGFIFAKDFIELLFGNNYAPAAPAFALLSFTLLVVFPGMMIGNSLFAYNEHRRIIKYVLLGIVANGALDYALIPA